jgi:hypothetical protein
MTVLSTIKADLVAIEAFVEKELGLSKSEVVAEADTLEAKAISEVEAHPAEAAGATVVAVVVAPELTAAVAVAAVVAVVAKDV